MAASDGISVATTFFQQQCMQTRFGYLLHNHQLIYQKRKKLLFSL
jgi:hypothetical protein